MALALGADPGGGVDLAVGLDRDPHAFRRQRNDPVGETLGPHLEQENAVPRQLCREPLADRVVILPQKPDEKTAGGIIIPDSASKDKPVIGKVVAGEGVTVR